MENINKKELIDQIAVAMCTSQAKAKVMLETVFEVIKQDLMDGKNVRINNFGVFSVVEKKERTVKSFGKEEGTIPAHKAVSFKIADGFKEKIK